MKIINNNEEFEMIYPYGKKYIKNYPTEYPCVCRVVSIEGGISGDHLNIYVAYFPKNKTSNESFFLGLSEPWKII